MDLNTYMEQGINDLAESLSLFYLKNAKGRRFLLSFLPALAKSTKIRNNYERQGQHIPHFLIASITSRCNLHCAGCYARSGGICTDTPQHAQLNADEWKRIFTEAKQLGISFILLAGGEPLLRRDVLEVAASFPTLAFPVFTNGTLFDTDYLDFFDTHRNLMPVLSIEGDAEETDERRGFGVAAKIDQVMQNLEKRGVLFAASVTVTKQNLTKVTKEDYLWGLREKGCGMVFLIEYVPAEPGTEHLMLSETEVDWLNRQVSDLRARRKNLHLFSFPGDESFTDGCLAAGRGFFHINPSGGAEPCPFSPFSALNVRNQSLLQILSSPFFTKVRQISQSDSQHNGGCTLFNHEEEVRQLL